MIITDFFKVIQAGKSLAQPGIASNRAAVGAILIALISGSASLARGVFGWQLAGLDDGTIAILATGMAAAVSLGASWLQLATTPDAGLPSKPSAAPDQ